MVEVLLSIQHIAGCCVGENERVKIEDDASDSLRASLKRMDRYLYFYLYLGYVLVFTVVTVFCGSITQEIIASESFSIKNNSVPFSVFSRSGVSCQVCTDRYIRAL